MFDELVDGESVINSLSSGISHSASGPHLSLIKRALPQSRTCRAHGSSSLLSSPERIYRRHKCLPELVRVRQRSCLCVGPSTCWHAPFLHDDARHRSKFPIPGHTWKPRSFRSRVERFPEALLTESMSEILSVSTTKDSACCFSISFRSQVPC